MTAPEPAGHPQAREIVAAVRACIGTRFRSQGRSPGVGLDCVGVALAAADAAGMTKPVMPHYQLGGDNEAVAATLTDIAGLVRITDARPGDLWIFAPAPGQRHFAVQVTETASIDSQPRRFVHAHAGIGRVVESPADPAWIQVAVFRFP